MESAPKKLTLTVGPFIGMNDTLNLASQDAKRASLITNMYNPAAAVGGDLISRPGYTRSALGTTVTRTGTATTPAMTAGVSYTVTGTSTLFTTEFAVGDIFVSNSGAEGIVTAIATNTSMTVTCEVAGTASGAVTYYPAGIKTGPIYGIFRYANTDGTTQRFIVVRSIVNQINGLGAGRFRFLAAATAVAGGVNTFPNGSTTVTGTGTAFLTDFVIGANVTFSSSGGEIAGGSVSALVFRVTAIATNTSMTVDTANTGTGAVSSQTMTAQNIKLRLVSYSFSDTTHPFTDRTSTSMNDVALSITARLYATTFANYLILSDGTNRPRKITSGYVLSNLTDGNYAAQGAPWVYYGKLFIVDGSDAITLRWSEENDPDTGYGTGTSDNSWSLRQTSADQLTGGIGSNEATYCGRQNSIAIITGAAASDFRSSGTVDAIQNIGTASPDAMVMVNSSMVFLDQYGRPGRIEPGYGYIPLWKRIQETLRGIGLTTALLRAAWCRYDPTTNLVKFGYRATNAATTNDQMLVFDADSWECLGLHEVYRTSAYAVADHAFASVWQDENNRPRFIVASGTTTDLAIYIQQTEDTPSASALEVTSGGSVTVAVTVRTPKIGGDPLMEKTFQRVTVGTRNVGGTTAGVTLWQGQYIGPYDTALTTAVALRIGNSATVPTSATFAGACLKAELQGINGKGRYIQVTFTNNTTGAPATRATLDTVTVQAMPEDADMARR